MEPNGRGGGSILLVFDGYNFYSSCNTKRVSMRVVVLKIAFLHAWTSSGKDASGPVFDPLAWPFPLTWTLLSLCLVFFPALFVHTTLKRTLWA
jgi:hypothetical protein